MRKWKLGMSSIKCFVSSPRTGGVYNRHTETRVSKPKNTDLETFYLYHRLQVTRNSWMWILVSDRIFEIYGIVCQLGVIGGYTRYDDSKWIMHTPLTRFYSVCCSFAVSDLDLSQVEDSSTRIGNTYDGQVPTMGWVTCQYFSDVFLWIFSRNEYHSWVIFNLKKQQ